LGVALALARTGRSVADDINRELGGGHGIALRDLELLLQLQSAPAHRLSLRVLATRLALPASEVLRLVAPLERTGMVDRLVDASDARATLAVLTAAGDTLTSDALATANEVAASSLRRRWSAAELAALRQALDTTTSS
jgi:DNA-binding MarR family transcriptional regulator